MTETRLEQGIEITKDGPYHVTGGIPLRRARKVPGERKGTFSGWEVYDEIDAGEEYWLCRCGASESKPFCSGMHGKVGFEGTETHESTGYSDRAQPLGGTKITVHDDRSICAHAAYCSNANTNIWKAAKIIDDDRELGDAVIGMVRACPSGALTYSVDGIAAEPEFGAEILVQQDGPYLLRGRIPITRSDGRPIEARNRMTVCRCGRSGNKPLCDGSHSEAGFTDG